MAGKNKAVLTLIGDSTKLEKALDRGTSAVSGMADEVESAGRKMRSSAESFDAVGEGAGALDTRAMGFRDTITGVQDSMAGWSQLMEGDVAGGLFTLGAGVGDLASGVENLIIPMAKSAAAFVTGNATMLASTVSSVAGQVVAWATLGVQSLLNAAKVAAAWLISMGPLILVGAAVIALVVLIIKNWDTIKEVIDKASQFVKRVAIAAFDALRAGVSRIIGALVAYVRFQIMVWTTIFKVGWAVIKAVTTAAWAFVQKYIIDRIRTAVTNTRQQIDTAVGFFKSLPARIGRAMAPLAQAITAPFRKGFGAIRGIWNSTVGGRGFSVPSWIPGIGGKSFRIPKLHTGGIYRAPGFRREGLALLETGEGVVSRNDMDNLQRSRPSAGAARMVLEIHSGGSSIDDAVVEIIRRAVSTRGGANIVLGAR